MAVAQKVVSVICSVKSSYLQHVQNPREKSTEMKGFLKKIEEIKK